MGQRSGDPLIYGHAREPNSLDVIETLAYLFLPRRGDGSRSLDQGPEFIGSRLLQQRPRLP